MKLIRTVHGSTKGTLDARLVDLRTEQAFGVVLYVHHSLKFNHQKYNPCLLCPAALTYNMRATKVLEH
jgi:hypothetical protein